MVEMFAFLKNFNQDISNWEISNTADTTDMFLENTTLPDNFKPHIGSTRNKLLRRQQEIQQKAAEAARQADLNKNETPYEECQICGDLLNNIDGPGPNNKCSENCNDVVKICNNNHLIHRGCVLNACNADKVNIGAQMGFDQYGSLKDQERKNNCPFCMTPLIVNCNEFRIIAKVPDSELIKPKGGKRKINKRTRKRRTKNRKTKKRMRETKKKRRNY
jgi:hypothetical protein